ncbi:MAG: radical SAM family heme chaperone HemW [bacterium]
MMHSGIYIHIPFCVKRCYYCDFYSETLKSKHLIETYGKKVVAELKKRFLELEQTKVVSLYVGGGTPSLMSENFFENLLKSAEKLGLPLDKMEITVEVNPVDLSDKWLKNLRNSGVNRISTGIQAFDDSALKEMGRRATVSQMKETLPLINDNFENSSIDIIYGIGRKRNIGKELETLFKFIQPSHVSAYQYLSPQKKNAPCELDEEESIVEEKEIEEFLNSKEILKYEVSNYAKKGKESVHNMLYWTFGSWLGIGAGAKSFNALKKEHSFYEENVENFINGKSDSLSRYFPENSEVLMEFTMMGLRVLDGIKLSKFKEFFGKALYRLFDKTIICNLVENGLLSIDKSTIKATDKGLDFLNSTLITLFEGIKK